MYFTFSPSVHPHLLPWWKVFSFSGSLGWDREFFISDLTKLGYWFIVVRLREPWFLADVTAVFLNTSSQKLRLEADHVTQDRRGSDGVEQKWVHRMTDRFSYLPLEWFYGSVVQIPTLLLRLFICLGQKSEQCQRGSTSNLPPLKKKICLCGSCPPFLKWFSWVQVVLAAIYFSTFIRCFSSTWFPELTSIFYPVFSCCYISF